jgi:small conductance mechanosensitive channel
VNRDRIPAVTAALLAPVQALVASSSSSPNTTTTTTRTVPGGGGVLGQANQVAAQQVTQGGGWLYHLLVKLGVSPDTASTVTDLIVRPLSILFVVLVAALVARYGARVIRRLLARVADRASARTGSTRAGARVTTMSGLAANIWRVFVFVVAGAIVLGMLGINLTPLLASATIIGATLGFGAQQIVRDYFSGALMTMEDQYNVGDSVTLGGVTGVIEDVTMRLTRFRGVDGTLYVIPNGDIRLVGNLSRGWARAVCDLTLPGAAAADLDGVRAVIEGAAHEVAQRPEFAGHVTEPPQVVGVLAADVSTITVRVMLLTVPSQRDPLTRALREAAIEALARAGLWPADAAATGAGTESSGPPPAS